MVGALGGWERPPPPPLYMVVRLCASSAWVATGKQREAASAGWPLPHRLCRPNPFFPIPVSRTAASPPRRIILPAACRPHCPLSSMRRVPPSPPCHALPSTHPTSHHAATSQHPCDPAPRPSSCAIFGGHPRRTTEASFHSADDITTPSSFVQRSAEAHHRATLHGRKGCAGLEEAAPPATHFYQGAGALVL